MQEIFVQVENDHIERVTSAKPIVALSELIWNAYDADASKVSVSFQDDGLTRLSLIQIEDDGTGIPRADVDSFFQSLGGSWKRKGMKTKRGRFIHGERGQGRFKAFALGASVTWISSANGQRFSIAGHRSDLKRFTISDLFPTTAHGCTVEIGEIQKDFEIRGEHGFGSQIRDVFALQLYESRDFEIIYDGERIDAREAIRSVTPCEITTELLDGKTISAKLEIVEWRRRVDRRLMLCLPGRFSFHAMAPGIHARGFDFTAYLTADLFQKMSNEDTEGLVELNPLAIALIDTAKNKLREHFRNREAERSRSKIQEWKDAKIYPYEGSPASDPIERNERQVFDVVALNLADYSNDFERAPKKQQQLILQLVKAAVETGPSALPAILEKVIDLPKDKQAELAELLRKTTLTAVINAARAVTDRLDFLKALQILVFDPRSKRQLLERSQLHRIIAEETWIFGEEFNLMNDDEDLSAVLRSHLELLGRDRTELSPEPVLDTEGRPAIVDLMLSCRMPTPTDYERKHLVVELKRPSQPINEDIISQVKKYAKAVASDDRFKAPNVEWDFVAISNSLTRDAEIETRQTGKARGLVAEYDEPKVRVWVKTWGQIISESEGRLTFYKRRLEYKANDVEALRYLRTVNPNYLSDEVREKIATLDLKDQV
ncbi:ATP-binding protein [Bradyrhizobium oligotrophicum]|uniref:ATP-binding protein n=1 Tax=Bradyrhizobium oligotrophicum TaxID=44255 RepID=UPI003EBED58F